MTREEIRTTVDRLIEEMNQVKQTQQEIGVSVIGYYKAVLVYDTNTFLAYADTLSSDVYRSGYVDENTGNINLIFIYKGYKFSAYATPEEYEQIKEKVLLPPKVTEPIQTK